jgi:proton-translocating NADH-quinone oxidoreductase chain N
MSAVLFKTFIPEIFLSMSILGQILFNVNLIINNKTNFSIINKEIFGQILFILFSVIFLYFNIKIESIFYNFIFINTLNEYFIKIFYLIFCLAVFIVIWRSFLLQKLNFFEFFTLLMISILSSLLLLNSLDLISVYLIIELQALCFYILSCFTRKSSFSTEAGLKYFISGAFISGFFLFGCSLIYSTLGTLNLNLISLLLTFPLTDNLNFIVLTGILFITITFMFKISAVPFHFWSPDVYEGSPLSSTIIFSLIPKLILFTFLIKWFSSISYFFTLVKYLLVLTGIASVFLGTFFAIQQKRIKRIMIYSSIAQIGFLVLGLSTNTIEGFSSVYFFLIIYLLTSTIIWSFITLFYTFQKKVNQFNIESLIPVYLSNLSNFFENNKLWSILITFIFYSLAGIPPFVGFFSKLFVLYGLMEVEMYFTVVILILISVISVFYYIRFIKLLFFEKKNILYSNIKYQTIFYDNFIEMDITNIVIGLFLLLYIFFYPNLLLLISQLFVLGNLSV